MAIKKLDEQIERVQRKLNDAMLVPNSIHVGMAKAEFLKLKFMLDGLGSFVEHRWQVKLIFGKGVVSENVDINAEHLEEAREVAISMVDTYDSAIDYELYCDGKQVMDHE